MKGETGEEILQCDQLGLNESQAQYNWFFSSIVSKQIAFGKVMLEKIKKKGKEQAEAELCQAQAKLEVIADVIEEAWS